MIIQAILKINPNAKVIVRGSDINTCEIEWLENTTPISKSEIEAMIPVVEQEIENAEANAIAKKESAKAKLAALGLDEEEIKAIIGV
jgi:uncharacterized small protein (DUF1192 family)